jgi:hypothetical protein
MADEDHIIQYTMRLVDNVSATRDSMTSNEKQYQDVAKESTNVIQQETIAAQGAGSEQVKLSDDSLNAEAALQGSSAAAIQATASEGQLASAVESTNNSMMARQINFISQVTMLRSLHASISLTTSAFQTLGLANADTIKGMQQLSAVMGLAVGIGQGFKGVTMLLTELREAEIGVAAIESFRAILQNPLALGLVAAGVGAAAGIGGYMLTQNSTQNTTVNQTVQFLAPAQASDQRQAARSALEGTGGF